MVRTKRNVEFEIKPFKQGAYVGRHLSFGLNGKVLEGNAIAANPDPPLIPTFEIDIEIPKMWSTLPTMF